MFGLIVVRENDFAFLESKRGTICERRLAGSNVDSAIILTGNVGLLILMHRPTQFFGSGLINVRMGEDQFAFGCRRLDFILAGFRLNLWQGLWPFSDRRNVYRLGPGFGAFAPKMLS